MNNFYLSQLLFNTPLAISERKLHTILEVLGPRLQGDVRALSANHAETILADPADHQDDQPEIAIIPVMGSLMHRTFGLQALSGLTSYQSIRSHIEQEVARGAHGIILDLDSPGGEVNGLLDLADYIHAIGQEIPVLALVDEFALSAAYAIASGARSIVMPRTGAAGSIGVLAVHMDQSQMDKKDGLKFTFIKAGALKDEGNPHAPLGNEARDRIQAEVDRVYGLFVDTVATHRGLSEEVVRAMEAGVLFGEEAVEAGLVDRIASREDAIAEFMEQVRSQSTPSVGFEPSGGTPAFAGSPDQKENRMPKTILTQTNTAPATTVPAEPTTAAPAANPVTTAQLETPASPDGAGFDVQVKQVATTYLAEVTQLCQLAGKPEKAAAFIKAGLNAEQIRGALLEARAREDEALAIATQAPVHTQPEPQSNSLDADAIFAKRAKAMAAR